MTLKFYTNTQSRGAVVDWLLIELGVTCERIEVAYQTEMKAPEYLKIHPFGKVPALVDVVVGDLSFISQTLVLPAVVPFLKPGGTLLTLVKPQFELQPGQVGKGGIVKDDAMYAIVEQRLREACAELGLTVTAWFDSPIEGGDGNREFFICATKAI